MMFAQPSTVQFRQLPISNFFEWDRVHDVRAILRQLQLGIFRDAALLVEDMGRDDRISGCVNIRLSKLLGLPVVVETVRLSRIGDRIAEAAQQLWPRMLPTAQISDLLRWGIMLGVGVGELLWDTKNTPGQPARWVPRMKIWHPQFLRWDWTRECFMLTTATGEVALPKVDDQVYSDGHWVIFCPFGYRYGWLKALVRPLSMPFLIRGWTYRDAARYSEVHGEPIRKAIVPTTATQDTKDRFVTDVSNMGNETALLLEQDPVAGKFDLDLLEAKADTYQVFEMLLERVEESIANTILGNAPGGKQPGLGSGQANQDEAIRMDTAKSDGEGLAQCLNDQVLHWYVAYNFGPDAADVVEASWNLDPPEDELQEAQLLQALFTALQIAATASLPIDVREILDAHGVPMLDPAEMMPPDQGDLPPDPNTPAPPPPAPGQQPGAPGAPAVAAGAAHPSGDQLPLINFAGFPIRVENAAGSVREGTDPDGKPWSTTMQVPYGYLDGVAGPDGDEVDVFVGPDEASPWVFVIHQHAPPDFGTWDEDKVMLGWPDANAAQAAYLAHYNDPRFLGRMTQLPLATFRAKLKARKSTGMIRAGAAQQRAVAASGIRLDSVLDPTTRDALAGSLARAQLLAGKPRSVRVRAAHYADRLASKGARLGGAAVKGDLAVLMRAVREATSPDDLRARVMAAYASMEPQRLARLVERAGIMAQLAGRHDVIASL